MSLSVQTAPRPRPQLATEDCSVFYNLRKIPLERIIAAAKALHDPSILRHALECEECRMHIQMRELFSSESEMDIQLNEALQCIK
jgi:hypothetical protein